MNRIVVAGPTTSAANIVRNALVGEGIKQFLVEHAQTPQDTASLSKGAALLIIDWDDTDTIAAEHLRQGQNAPVVIFSSRKRQMEAERITGGHSLGFIAKPAEPKDIANVIRSALAKASAGKKAGARSPKVEYINPFIDATIKAFQTMAGMEVIRKKVYLKDSPNVNGDVSGIMGLSGQATGNVAISLSAKLACTLFGKMVGCEPPPEPDRDVCDAVGEMINMISGQAKAALATSNYKFSISLPQIVMGRDHEVVSQDDVPNIAILHETEGMEFTVQVAIKEVGA